MMGEFDIAPCDKDRGNLFYPLDLSHGYSRVWPLLDLAKKLNRAFLKAHDLDEILQAVLVGITMGEGLGFNRAFLLWLNGKERCLQGELAIGPLNPEDAQHIWAEMSRKRPSLFDILDNVRDTFYDDSYPLNKFVRQMKVPLSAEDHILVQSVTKRQAFLVKSNDNAGLAASQDLIEMLGTDEFVVAPLFTQEESYGVILADNFITRFPIEQEDVDALQLFACFASIAISRVRMCKFLEERIEALKTLNNELEHNKDLLVEAERYAALGRMADQLAHGIRNPLSVIGGMARILEKKIKDPKLACYVNTIVKQSGRLEKTLDEVLDFNQAPDLHLEHVSLYDLIETCLALFQTELDRHNINLETHFPSSELILYVDCIYLQQAFLNILRNAVDAMPDGGSLIVSLSIFEENIEIYIVDTGFGMTGSHLSKADEPFFTTKVQGLGLGLNLAKRAVELHGGRLYLIRNRLGGITVTVTLPRK
ncbi:MAG: GAF domain-containing protein [Nitrospiraceae bacterium]|nr:GAF domain-containing protein [Nitrospiraceae bacterium]